MTILCGVLAEAPALAARLDRLPAEEKRLLQTAAVVGPEVPVPLLQAIAELPEATLHRGLAHVQAAEFLYETQLFPEQVYTFKHALTHEVVYNSLLLERRRVLHTRMVEILERLSPDQLADQVDRLAHHALWGEVWAKAVTYCQQAGARAYDRAAFREAVAACEQALQALAHLPDDNDTRVLAIEIRDALGNALPTLERMGGASPCWARPRPWPGRSTTGPGWDGCWPGWAMLRRQTGAQDGAIAAGRQALDLAAELGDTALQVQASYFLGQVYAAIGDFGRAAELRGGAWRRRTGCLARPVPCGSGPGRGWRRAWARSGPSPRAGATGRRRSVSPRGPAAGSNRSWRTVRSAPCTSPKGTWSPPSGCWSRAWLSVVPPVTGPGCAALADLGYATALQGRLTEGRALLEEALSESIRTGALRGQACRVAWLSEVCRLACCGAEAWQHACRALDLARQLKERGNEAFAIYQLGVVHAHADPPDVEQAPAYYQQALALAEELGMRPLQAHCHLGLGTLYATIGQRQQARAELATAAEMYRAMAMTLWLPQAEGRWHR